MMKDCCFLRDIKQKVEYLETEQLDAEAIETLFKDNTKKDIQEKVSTAILPASGLSKATQERLKIEFRFIKQVIRLLHKQDYEEAMSLIGKYYKKQLCKSKNK